MQSFSNPLIRLSTNSGNLLLRLFNALVQLDENTDFAMEVLDELMSDVGEDSGARQFESSKATWDMLLSPAAKSKVLGRFTVKPRDELKSFDLTVALCCFSRDAKGSYCLTH